RLRVVDDVIERLAGRFDERTMADAPDVFGLLEDGRRALGPGRGIQNVTVRVGQKTQAVVLGPASTRGINDENLAVILEDLRALADRHRDAFPGLVGFANQHALAAERVRIAHRRDVDVLLAIDLAGPAGPGEE